MTKVSVLMPVYAAEPYLDVAVESLLAQTMESWELVAVDDASPDESRARLDAWASRDARVRVFSNSERRGVTGNWNECLHRARGAWVIKLDADDAFRPRALEKLLTSVDAPGRVGAGIRALVCDPALEPLGGYPSDEAMRRAGIDPYVDHTIPCERWYSLAAEGVQLWNGDAFMSRRELLVEMGGLDETYGCPSDTDLLIRLLERAGVFGHVAYPGLLYRRYEGSTSDTARKAEGMLWEGQVLLLASLARTRTRRRLTRAEVRRYVRWWDSWRRYSKSPPTERAVPPERFAALSTVFDGIAPPTLGERIIVRSRDWLSSRAG
jgi:glycosyltransferase involved in cell wall biosynthesis